MIPKLIQKCVLAAAVGLSFSGAICAGQDLEQELRLKAGNYWVYRGTVEWTYVDTTPPQFGKKRITWKSEILEETARGDLKAFLVQGSFFDLPWYEPDTRPGQYIWIVYRDRFYSIAVDPEILARFHDARDSLIDLVLAEEPILQAPLHLGRCTVGLKPTEPRQRPDLRYCWYLENRRKQNFDVIGPAHNLKTVWTARYQTLPSHEILGFAPGIGFVSFDFSHHGTLSEAHVKLVKARLQ